MKKIKNNMILILLLLNLASSCGQIVDVAKANQSYQLVNLYGYECITNYVSIWCR